MREAKSLHSKNVRNSGGLSHESNETEDGGCNPVNIGPDDNSRRGLWMEERENWDWSMNGYSRQLKAKSAVEEVFNLNVLLNWIVKLCSFVSL